MRTMLMLSQVFKVIKVSPCRRVCSRAEELVRVRFAPSPTGHLHLGGLRTAFYNYMFAKRNNGKFVLRIEDTDQKRIQPGSAENLENMLSWVGLCPDESPILGGPYGPYVQSQRIEKYQNYAKQLLESGLAYRCFCSETRLDLLRKVAMQARQNPRYDNKCRHLTPSEIEECLKKKKAFTIRFKIQEGPLSFDDIVYGPTTLDVSEYEGDFIIIKSDGYPTYHFACIVDDHLMLITHVLRGTEWLVSTPKHIMLHEALKWTPPKFAHLPLLINSDGSKLSKRQDAISMEYFQNNGFAPEAILNFLASAGGGFGYQSGITLMDLKDLSSKFDLSDVRTHPCVLDMQRLTLYSHHYLLKQMSDESKTAEMIQKFRSMLKTTYGKKYEENETMSDGYIKRIFNCYKERVDFLTELVKPDMAFLWTSPEREAVITKLQQVSMDHAVIVSTLREVKDLLQRISNSDFTLDHLQTALKKISSDQGLKYKTFMLMLRMALTGQKEGPGIAEIFFMLGQEKSCHKLDAALELIKAKT